MKTNSLQELADLPKLLRAVTDCISAKEALQIVPPEEVVVGRSVFTSKNNHGGYVRVELVDEAGHWKAFKRTFAHNQESLFIEFLAPANANTHELREAWTDAYADEAPSTTD